MSKVTFIEAFNGKKLSEDTNKRSNASTSEAKTIDMFYQCECMEGRKDPETNKEYYSVFYIGLNDYECAHCDKRHSFEDVHGSIDHEV